MMALERIFRRCFSVSRSPFWLDSFLFFPRERPSSSESPPPRLALCLRIQKYWYSNKFNHLPDISVVCFLAGVYFGFSHQGLVFQKIIKHEFFVKNTGLHYNRTLCLQKYSTKITEIQLRNPTIKFNTFKKIHYNYYNIQRPKQHQIILWCSMTFRNIL